MEVIESNTLPGKKMHLDSTICFHSCFLYKSFNSLLSLSCLLSPTVILSQAYGTKTIVKQVNLEFPE